MGVARLPAPLPRESFRDPETGEVWHKYGIRFETDGLAFGTYIYARGWEDAEKRLADLKRTAVIDGQILEEIKA